MRVLLTTYGSRGDVQPLAALGVALQSVGAEAVVCAPGDGEFAQLLERAGVPLAPAFMAIREWLKTVGPRAKVDLPTRAAEIMVAQYDAIGAAADGCDVILATGLMPSS